MRQWLGMVAAALVLALAGCGGGSASGVPGASAEGEYAGTDAGSALYVLDDGTFYLLNMPLDGGWRYYAYGSATGVAGRFSATGTLFTYSGDMYANPATVSGSYVAGSSISVTLHSQNTDPAGVSFTGSFVPGFLSPALQADATGTYENPYFPGEAVMTVDAAGNLATLASLMSPCGMTGTIHPHGKDRLYDAQLTFNGAPSCVALGTKSGVAIPQGTLLLFVMNDGYFNAFRKAS